VLIKYIGKQIDNKNNISEALFLLSLN